MKTFKNFFLNEEELPNEKELDLEYDKSVKWFNELFVTYDNDDEAIDNIEKTGNDNFLIKIKGEPWYLKKIPEEIYNDMRTNIKKY